MTPIKFYSLVFIHCILIFSCENQLMTQGNILFEQSKLDNNCGSGFTVNSKLEANVFYRAELERYLYKAFIDSERCQSISSALYIRKSFVKMVLEVYTDNNFLNYSIYDYESRWRESYINLLRFCENDSVFYLLCDTLLQLNIDDGVLAVWDKGAKNLNFLKLFAENNKEDYYQQAQIIAVYHNNNMIKERDMAIKNLKKLSQNMEGIDNSFLDLMEEGEKIDYMEFMEVVFGGM